MDQFNSKKRYIRKNLYKRSILEIADDLGVTKNQLVQYLEKELGSEKLAKLLSKTSNLTSSYPTTKWSFLSSAKTYFQDNKLIFLGLLSLIILVYGKALFNEFASDDIASISQNPLINEFSWVLSYTLQGPPIRPFIYWTVHQIAGETPFFYRIFNLAFHLGSTYLVFIIVNILVNRRVGILSALFFSIHPLLIEAVTWISGGAYSQATFFTLLTLLLYLLKYRSKMLYWISLPVYLIAISSQIIVAAFIPVLIVLELSRGLLVKNWLKIIPYFLISLPLAFTYLGGISDRASVLQTVHYTKPEALDPLLVTVVAISTYLELLFWPDQLTLYHSELSLSRHEYIIKLIEILIFVILIVITFIKQRKIFFWLMFFILFALPTLISATRGLTWVVAERYAYLPSIGLFVVVAFFIDKILRYHKFRTHATLLIVLLIIGLSLRSIIRNNDWKTADDLWLSAERTSPSSPNNHNNLGDLYGRRGDYNRAISEFKTAIALKPNYGDAYHNLGNTYFQLGQDQLALDSFTNAVKLNPNLWQSYQNIASIYFKQEKYPQAIDAMKKALAINPTNPAISFNMGVIYLKMGDKQNAKLSFTKALDIDPNYAIARQALSEIEK